MTEEYEDNFKLISIAELISLLQKCNQDHKIAVYKGCAREFTSEYGWETAFEDDSEDIQVFSKSGILS